MTLELHRADDFRGDDAHLISCIDALLDLDDAKALVPHGLGGKGSHAYRLFCAARHRLAAQAQPEGSNECHPSHKTRSSDSSFYDEVCLLCGATDIAGGGWGKLAQPCPAADFLAPKDAALSIVPQQEVREALVVLCAAIDQARNTIPDEEEGLAADVFAKYLNLAQMKAHAALAGIEVGQEGEGL